MTKESAALWDRTFSSLGSAERELSFNVNASASRAYYSPFNALSAHFALKGVLFKSHDGVQIFLHKELIKPGIFPPEFSEMFKSLKKSRQVGDYGVYEDVSEMGALSAIEAAKKIIEAVYNLHPDEFDRPDWMLPK
jgi:uncharacterized protein (UPF0332 family)